MPAPMWSFQTNKQNCRHYKKTSKSSELMSEVPFCNKTVKKWESVTPYLSTNRH